MLEGWAVIQASWRTGPAETLTENSTRTNGKSLTEEERMTCNNWSGPLPAGEQLRWKQIGFIGRQQAKHEITVCLAAKRVNRILGCRKSQPRDWSSPTTQHSSDHIYNTMRSFGSPNTEKISTIGSRFSKGHLDAEGPEHLACVEGSAWRWDGRPSRTYVNNTMELASLPGCTGGRWQTTATHRNKRSLVWILGQTVRMAIGRQWNRSPGKVVQSPSCLGGFQNLSE